MFTSVGARSVAAYKKIGLETSDSYQLVCMLFDGLLKSVDVARAAMKRGDIATKGEQIMKAVRILDEGLKPALNLEQGGDLAANLNGLYGYCALRLTQANLRNDDGALGDVVRVIGPLAQGWKQMGDLRKQVDEQPAVELNAA